MMRCAYGATGCKACPARMPRLMKVALLCKASDGALGHDFLALIRRGGYHPPAVSARPPCGRKCCAAVGGVVRQTFAAMMRCAYRATGCKACPAHTTRLMKVALLRKASDGALGHDVLALIGRGGYHPPPGCAKNRRDRCDVMSALRLKVQQDQGRRLPRPAWKRL